MTAKTISQGILRAIGIIVAIVVTCYFLYKIQSVLAYLAIAAVVALIGRPVVLFLRRKFKFPNLLAVMLTMLLMVGILVGIIALFVPLISEQGKNLSLLNIEALQLKINALYLEITKYFGGSPATMNELLTESELGKSVLEKLDVGFIPNFLFLFKG